MLNHLIILVLHQHLLIIQEQFKPWLIPNGVTFLNIDLAGAQGGTFNTGYGTGGYGGRVKTTLNVTPGQTLYLYIGGLGGSAYTAGWNGGGLGSANNSYSPVIYTYGSGGGGLN